jgi:hypothetical protein
MCEILLWSEYSPAQVVDHDRELLHLRLHLVLPFPASAQAFPKHF